MAPCRWKNSFRMALKKQLWHAQVQDMRNGLTASGGEVLGNIVSKTLWLAVGGALIGLGFGIVMRYILRWMRHLGAGIEQQVAMTFAIGYLSYYTANAPAHVSGAQGS